jgi:hypothetical protein
MRRDIEMTAGLPGTGIGGIFYLSLAICMPIREFVHTLKGQTNLKRWSFISIQLLFVFGIVAAMWFELWLLNRFLIWIQGYIGTHDLSLTGGGAFSQTKFLALVSAAGSFVSLTFVITGVHILRFFVHRSHRGQPLSIPKGHPAILKTKPMFLAHKAS